MQSACKHPYTERGFYLKSITGASLLPRTKIIASWETEPATTYFTFKNCCTPEIGEVTLRPNHTRCTTSHRPSLAEFVYTESTKHRHISGSAPKVYITSLRCQTFVWHPANVVEFQDGGFRAEKLYSSNISLV